MAELPPVATTIVDNVVFTALQGLAATLPKPVIVPPAPAEQPPVVTPLGDLVWTFAMEEAMYREMITQHRLYKRAGSTFKAEAWTYIIAAVQAVCLTGHTSVRSQCQNKSNSHKAKWALWRILRYKLSGWSFNESTQLLVADDAQWTAQIAKNKIAAQLRNRPLFFVDEFDELYNGRVATGDHVQAMNPTTTGILVDPSLQGMLPPGTLQPPATPRPDALFEDNNETVDEGERAQGTAKKRHRASALVAQAPC